MTTEDPDNADWDLRSMEVQWGINNSKHRITDCAPSDVVYRFRTNSRVDNPLTKELNKINESKGNPNTDINPTKALQKNRESELKKISQRKEKPEKYQRGDRVLVKWEARASG